MTGKKVYTVEGCPDCGNSQWRQIDDTDLFECTSCGHPRHINPDELEDLNERDVCIDD